VCCELLKACPLWTNLLLSDNRVRQISDKQAIDTKKELSKVANVSNDTITL